MTPRDGMTPAGEFRGLRVVTSLYLTEAGEPYEARRTWRERLFSRPWQPFKATQTVVPQVPMRGGYQIGQNTVVMHPDTWQQLKGTSL